MVRWQLNAQVEVRAKKETTLLKLDNKVDHILLLRVFRPHEQGRGPVLRFQTVSNKAENLHVILLCIKLSYSGNVNIAFVQT